MSDHSISIVPKLSAYPNREAKAKEILEWLVSVDIIKPALSDCSLGQGGGYAISQGAKQVTTEPEYLPFGLVANGLEITTKRELFLAGENGMDELICPNCKQNIASQDWDFLNEWVSNISNNLTCPACNVSSDIQKFKFTPEWGFSDLGFTFWNWPSLADDFIEEFKQRLGCDIDIVHAWI